MVVITLSILFSLQSVQAGEFATVLSAPVTSGEFTEAESPGNETIEWAIDDNYLPRAAPDGFQLLSVGINKAVSQSDPVKPNPLIGHCVLHHHYFVATAVGRIGLQPFIRVGLVDYQQYHMIPTSTDR